MEMANDPVQARYIQLNILQHWLNLPFSATQHFAYKGVQMDLMS